MRRRRFLAVCGNALGGGFLAGCAAGDGSGGVVTARYTPADSSQPGTWRQSGSNSTSPARSRATNWLTGWRRASSGRTRTEPGARRRSPAREQIRPCGRPVRYTSRSRPRSDGLAPPLTTTTGGSASATTVRATDPTTRRRSPRSRVAPRTMSEGRGRSCHPRRIASASASAVARSTAEETSLPTRSVYAAGSSGSSFRTVRTSPMPVLDGTQGVRCRSRRCSVAVPCVSSHFRKVYFTRGARRPVRPPRPSPRASPRRCRGGPGSRS